jgi:hypothetical protein
MMLFLNLLTVSLLAVVGGLLLAVNQQVRVWRRAMVQSPLLAEQLATQLLAARHGLDDLRKGVTQQGPELSRMLSEGQKLRTELQFLLEKAETTAARLDMKLDKAATPALKATKAQGAVIEQVAGANGHAIMPSGPSHDPLEELLAGLQTPPVTLTSPTSNRRGPVTQAELTLQQKINGPLNQPRMSKNA